MNHGVANIFKAKWQQIRRTQHKVFVHRIKTKRTYHRTTAPKWRPGKADQNLGSITGYKLFDGYITGHKAWALVQGLQKGQAVSFTYRDVQIH